MNGERKKKAREKTTQIICNNVSKEDKRLEMRNRTEAGKKG